jgi:F0F1-type ATP synthase assembly protein I
VLALAIALIVLGVVVGIFFPVMFLATAAGIVMLLIFFFGAGRRAKTGAVGTEEPGSRAE